MSSFLYTATNISPHVRFFNFQRRSCSGESCPSWMINPNRKTYLGHFVRSNKADPMVDEVEVINVYPHYATVRHTNGRKVTVSLNDLASLPQRRELEYSVNNDSDEINVGDAPASRQDPSTCENFENSKPDSTPDNHAPVRRSS